MKLRDKISGLSDMDTGLMPEPTQRLTVVSGSWREMGRQYAEQCRAQFLVRAGDVLSEYLSFFGDSKRAFEAVGRYLEAPAKEFPQLIALLEGMAEATGLCMEAAAMVVYGKSMLRAEQECSHAAAWDSATADGHMLTACNVDLGTDASGYLPAIVAFPEDGYAFFSAENFHRNGMNETGLILQCAGGQNAGEGDTIAPGCRHMWNDANMFALANCAGVEETIAAYRRWRYVVGCNQFVGDRAHEACVIEFTASKFCVRRAGDYGERDYLLANNDYLAPELQDSIFRGALYWDDTRPRYWTVERLLRDALGGITPDTMQRAEGCYRFYIPEGWALAPAPEWGGAPRWTQTCQGAYPAGWHEDWTAAHGQWSPQMKSPFARPGSRYVMDGDTRTIWGMRDGTDTLFSHIPGSLGTFWKIQLGGTIAQIVLRARAELETQLWLAERDTAERDLRRENGEYIRQAKARLFLGSNLRAMAVCLQDAGQTTEANARFGRALSAYCEGQCLARLAQREPERLAQGIDATTM